MERKQEKKAQVNLDEAQQKGGDLTLSVDVLRVLAVGQQEVQHLEVHARQLSHAAERVQDGVSISFVEANQWGTNLGVGGVCDLPHDDLHEHLEVIHEEEVLGRHRVGEQVAQQLDQWWNHLAHLCVRTHQGRV
jgi:hypothetical protein